MYSSTLVSLFNQPVINNGLSGPVQISELYYGKINRLIDVYRAKGYTSMVHDWERRLSKVADYPDLRSLAKRGRFSLQRSLNFGPE